jgi:hypothetical protein
MDVLKEGLDRMETYVRKIAGGGGVAVGGGVSGVQAAGVSSPPKAASNPIAFNADALEPRPAIAQPNWWG